MKVCRILQLFPNLSPGWNPWEVRLRDGNQIRTVNFKSKDFVKFGMYKPIYGTMFEWEALEKHWQANVDRELQKEMLKDTDM